VGDIVPVASEKVLEDWPDIVDVFLHPFSKALLRDWMLVGLSVPSLYHTIVRLIFKVSKELANMHLFLWLDLTFWVVKS